MGPAPLEGGLTRYISTRGEAPVLGFCDVMLAGLARDGGLYVPEVWPQLSCRTIAGFFGRPYWEVAVDVIRPFTAGEIFDADLGRMANEAYATFRHPAVETVNWEINITGEPPFRRSSGLPVRKCNCGAEMWIVSPSQLAWRFTGAKARDTLIPRPAKSQLLRLRLSSPGFPG